MTYSRIASRFMVAATFVVAILFVCSFTAFASSVDPVAEAAPAPAVLGESTSSVSDPIDATIDPVANEKGSADPAVLGVSVDSSVDPVDGMVLGESTDTPAAESMAPSMDPVLGIDSVSGNQLAATAALNVRVSPSAATERVGIAFPGMTATVIGGPIEFGGFKWLQVAFENGLSGWSVSDWLK